MSRTLEVFEHSRLSVTASGDGIRPAEFDALVQFNDRHGGQYFDIGYKSLKTKNFVGYVEVGDLALEILPKADRGNTGSAQVWRAGLLDMLRVTLGLKLDHLPDAGQRFSRNRLLDLIAQAYLSELESLFREGLAKGYRTTQSNGVVFRGRLKMSEHLRENIARADRFFVEYQTFDHDIPVNRVLAAALEALSWCGLSPSVACAVDATLSQFPDLQLSSVTTETFDRIVLARATQRYAKALIYARMILSQRGPQLRGGRERVFALLFDMNTLWERFIAILMRRAAPRGMVVSTQERHAFWKPLQHGMRRVRPDIVVRAEAKDGKGKTLLVIDTKWKVPANGMPSDDDLKQMFVYNELLAGSRSMLLYPATQSSFPASGSYATKGHGCEQFHVGVLEGAKWNNTVIKQQLGGILAQLSVA